MRSATPLADAYFGGALAAEGRFMLVGSPQQAGFRGLGQLFELNGGAATLVSTLAPADGAIGDRLGYAAAMDAQALVLGAPYRASGTGAVRVYARDAQGRASSLDTLVSPDPVAGDQFGASVAVSGEWLFVGEISDDGAAGVNQGAVQVFRRGADGRFAPHAKLVCPEAQANKFFGMALATDGARLVVGARLSDNAGIIESGGAWVYEIGASGPLEPPVRLQPSAPGTYDWFGQAVALEGDRVVVGACRDTVGKTDSQGSVRIFRRTPKGQWPETAVIVNPTGASLDRFGTAVAIRNGVVAVGADGEDRNGIESAGTVRTLVEQGGAWTTTRFIELASPTLNQYLGFTVAFADGHLVSGAPKRQVAGGPLREGVVGVLPIAAPCPADLDASGAVDAADLAQLLAQWGAVGTADLDGSGAVDAADLAALLAAWGPC
ncbi:MAG: hypothetical protein ACKOYN_08545 [Planctomycetota bacterium]